MIEIVTPDSLRVRVFMGLIRSEVNFGLLLFLLLLVGHVLGLGILIVVDGTETGVDGLFCFFCAFDDFAFVRRFLCVLF